jgi:hypothetical protein
VRGEIVVEQEDPSSVEPLTGNAFYEQARGIVIGAFGCTPDEAAELIGAASIRAGLSPTDLVAKLVSPETRQAELRSIGMAR